MKVISDVVEEFGKYLSGRFRFCDNTALKGGEKNMTPFERLYAAVNFEEYDRPPFSDNEWNEILSEVVPYYSGCKFRKNRTYAGADRACAVRAVMDMVPWGHIYGTRYPVLGEIPDIKDGERAVSSDGFTSVFHRYTTWIEKRPFLDLGGFTEYMEKMIEGERNASPKLPQDFWENFKYAKKMMGDTVIAHPYTSVSLDGLYPLAGWEIFGQVVMEKPALLAEYLDAAADATVKRVHIYCEYFTAKQCPVVLVYSDIAYKNGLLLSPKFLRMSLKPAFSKIASAFHEHGIKVVYHSEGDIREFIDDLIEAGADGINPVDSNENMDAPKIRQKYPELILWGGIENSDRLVFGTPAEIRWEVERVVDGVGRGLIVGASGGVHPACKLQNCIEMVDALHKMSK